MAVNGVCQRLVGVRWTVQYWNEQTVLCPQTGCGAIMDRYVNGARDILIRAIAEDKLQILEEGRY